MLTNNKVINVIFLGSGILTLLVLIAASTISQPINLANNLTPDLMNSFYRIGASIALLSIITFFINKIQSMSKAKFWSMIGIIFVIQVMFIIVFIRSLTTDTAYVFNQAEQLANGNYDWLKYFKIYPNNVMISAFWMLFYKLFNFLHITNHYLGAVLVQTIIYDFGIVFAYNQLKIIPKFHSKWFLLIGFAYFPLWLFNLFIYNDIIGLSILLICIGFFTKFLYGKGSNLRKYCYFFMSILALTFGIVLRQNLMIVLIALLITIIFVIKKTAKQKLILLLITFGLFGAMNIGSKSIQKQLNFETDNQTMMPTVSWINMGLNVHSAGQSDVYDTWNWYSIDEPERTKELKDSIKYRLDTTPKIDLIKLFWHKARITFTAGLPLMDFKDVRSDVFSINAPRFFYVLAQIAQPIYITLFILALLSIMQNVKIIKELSPIVVFSILSIVGIFLFHVLLWESRDRYGIVILPFIFVLASMTDFSGFSLIYKKKMLAWIIGIIGTLLLIVGGVTNINAIKNKQVINRETSRLTYSDYTYSHPIKLYKNTEYKFKFEVDNYSNVLFASIKDSELTRNELKKININIYSKNNRIIKTNANVDNRYKVKLKPGSYVMKIDNKNNHDIPNSRLFVYSNKNIKWPDDTTVQKNNKNDYSIEPTLSIFEQNKQTLISSYWYVFIFVIYLALLFFGIGIGLNKLTNKNNELYLED